MSARVPVAVIGATGYAGRELVRLLARHPGVDLVAAMASREIEGTRRLPGLARIWDGQIESFQPDRIAGRVEAAFLALPDTQSAAAAPALLDRGIRVLDLSGAFRLRADEVRARWYPGTTSIPAGTIYGLTERARDALRGATLISCPGCYPTAALLALGPLVDRRLVEGDVFIDAKSGVSGAGKTPTERTHFSECHGNVSAYGVFSHRHGAEIEQELGCEVTFVPHLVPLDRGILETIYVRLRPGVGAGEVGAALRAAYADAPFVRLTGDELPEVKHVAYTNFCDIGWKVDATGRRLVLVACLDNLVKGAAGQAIQNFNVACGFDEGAGL